ncbi:hypothetical protein ABZ845_06840 [Streptomyces sp. NPDC047022]|uniref:hypothetical protein n=1 Tax=Streptomyces sp. NPDC047022 TaxID=3155737 RepID=UPI0033E4E89B
MHKAIPRQNRGLDTGNRTLSIRRTLQNAPNGGTALYPTKTHAAERRIAIRAACLTALAQHCQAQDTERQAAGEAWEERNLVFATRAPPCYWKQGVELVTIKELLGHAHIAVTAEVYAHVRLRLQHQAIEARGRALADADDRPLAATHLRWPNKPECQGARTVTTVRGSFRPPPLPSALPSNARSSIGMRTDPLLD